MRTRLKITVTVQEDLHTGTGQGGGGLDAVVARGIDGRPVLRSSHVKGLLREALEELADWDDQWKGAAQRICGAGEDWDGKPMSRTVEGGQKNNGQGSLVLTSLRPSNDVQTLAWVSTRRVEGGSRRPQEDTLRAIEFIPADAVFEGELEIEEGDRSVVEQALKHVAHMGSQRRRGAGRVQVKVEPAKVTSTEVPPFGPDDTVLRLRLEAIEPLVLGQAPRGNITPTHSRINGHRLRGAFAWWSARSGGQPTPLLGRDILYGEALPLPPGELGALATMEVRPIPLSVVTPKPAAAGDPLWPFWAEKVASDQLGARGELDRLSEEKATDEKPKRPGAHEYLYRAKAGEAWRRYSPTIAVHLRNAAGVRKRKQIEDRNKAIDLDFFIEEEVAEGTIFMAEIRFQNKDLRQAFVQQFRRVLEGHEWLRVGNDGRPVVIKEVAWCRPVEAPKPTEGGFTVTLDSDLIARGPRLGFHAQLTAAVLAELVGIPAEGCRDAAGTSERTVVRGYHAVTRLPRNPVLAIRRGSTVRIEGGAALRAALVARQFVGLGERTDEGCGRFTLDLDLLPPGAKEAKVGGAKGQPVAELHERLIEAAKGLANGLGSAEGLRMTQWQGVRDVARVALSQRDDKAAAHVSQALGRLIAHAGTSAGKPWKPAVGGLERLKAACEREGGRNAAILLDYTTRWCIADLKAAEQGKAGDA